MPTTSRRTRPSVIERLLANPEDFSFVQAVRLLERAAVFAKTPLQLEEKNSSVDHPVARFSPPLREVVRFNAETNLGFPSSEIGEITLNKERQQWKMVVNFLGLTGSMGIMPFHYSELILQRLKLKDHSLAEFFNLFNHRTTSLFFQASAKYRLPLEYERSKLHQANKTKSCTHTQSLLSLLGLGNDSLRNRQTLRDESLIYFSGLFTQQVKTSAGLEQMVEHYFGVPVKLEGFIGQWQELIDDVRTRLPSKGNKKGQNACLGKSAMLGKKGWFAQGKSRVKIGPLNKDQFHKFAPGTGALQALNEMVDSYMGMENDFDFMIEVDRNDVPNKVNLDKDNPPTLAWNAWLSGKPKTNTEKDDRLEILVSSKKLNTTNKNKDPL